MQFAPASAQLAYRQVVRCQCQGQHHHERPHADSYIGTLQDICPDPVQPLHIKKDGNVTFKFESNTAGGGVAWNFKINANGAFSISKVGTTGAELLLFDADSAKTLDIKGPIEATSFDVASSRAFKTGFELLDPETALSKVAEMPISRWQYKDDPMGAVHIGPMAEDFHAAFSTGSDESISLTDANGVALAAIQGLLERIEKLEQALAER